MNRRSLLKMLLALPFVRKQPSWDDIPLLPKQRVTGRTLWRCKPSKFVNCVVVPNEMYISLYPKRFIDA